MIINDPYSSHLNANESGRRNAGAIGSGFQARLPAPFAVLGIRTMGECLTDIQYLPKGVATLAPTNRFAERVSRQIARYLDDPEFRFDVPFEYRGTAFQCRVWRAISSIPSGRTLTYLGIAKALGTAPRPVGGACGANRIPLVIPCHRVLGSGGIGGFMNARGGFPLEVKRWLLRHEGVRSPGEHEKHPAAPAAADTPGKKRR